MDEDDIAERRRAEAAQWFARLKSLPVSHGTLNEFFAWRRLRGNAEAFEEAERFWSSAEHVGERPEILRAVEAAVNRKSTRHRLGSKSRPILWLAASVALVLLFYGGNLVFSPREQIFVADAGEQRTFALDDGSHLDLNSGSRVRVDFTAQRRLLVLERGDAFFAVAKDKMRPFSVRAGAVTITATGTRFDVAKQDERVTVTLIEGRVVVRAPDGSSQLMRAGEQWRWPAAGAPIRQVNTDNVTAWRRGRTVFDDTLLADAIAQINRHSGKPILLDAAGLGSERISGSFEAGDAENFAAAVTAFLPLRQQVDSQGRIHLVADHR